MSAAFNTPAGKPVVDALLKASSRADVPATLFKAVRKSLQNNTAQLAELATIGALREKFKGIGPGNWFITNADKMVRLLLDDAYQEMAQNGLVENTETARREFINQVGQYNTRLQGPLIRLLRDTGLGPFATAGRTFNALGVRQVLLSPGVKAASPSAALALRANMLGSIVGFIVLRSLINQMTTGNPNGRHGTRLMNIDLGDNDNNGKPRQFPLGDLLGPGRGLRVTGLRGYVEGQRAGLTTSQSTEDALRDMFSSFLNPAMGPAPKFAATALTGYPAINAPRTAPVPKPDQNRYALQFGQALKDANPFVAAAIDMSQGKDVKPSTGLGRFSPVPGMVPEKYEALPTIVRRSRTKEYKEYVIREANKLPRNKRLEFIRQSIQDVNLSPRDKAEIRYRTRY